MYPFPAQGPRADASPHQHDAAGPQQRQPPGGLCMYIHIYIYIH